MTPLLRHGEVTFQKVEVTNISAYGVWLLTDDTEMFMPFDQFPW
jgi:hypothetical protein